MKANYKYFIFFTLAVFLSLSISSCTKKLSPEQEQSKLDSAKAFFNESETLPPTEKTKIYANLEKSIKLLKEVINNNNGNLDAWYYYGYALDKQISAGDNSINFKTMSYNNSQKVSEIFENIIDKDPKYSSDYKLSPYSKISSTWGSLALYYIVMKKPDSAKVAFEKAKSAGGITEANTEYCRNLLLSCKQNAILFVKGDLETFALWRLQFVENQRKDVSVINIGLLATQWYAKWVTKTNSLGAKLEIKYDDNQLDTLYNSLITYSEIKTKTINYLGAKPELAKDFSDYDGSNIEFTLQGRHSKDNKILLLPHDFFMLGIIEKNIFQRPIYFSLTVGREEIVTLGLTEYMSLEGLASRLMPYKIPGVKSVNINKVYDLIINKFAWSAAAADKAFQDRDFSYLAEYYKFVFIQMNYYYSQIVPDKALCSIIYNKYFELFPAVRLPLNEKEQQFYNGIKMFLK